MADLNVGSTISYDQLAQWYAQNPGPYKEDLTTEILPSVSGNEDDITKQGPQRAPSKTITAANGAKIKVRINAGEDPGGSDSTYVVTAVEPPSTKATTLAKAPDEKDEGGRRFVWVPNPDGQGGKWQDVGPAPETPQEAARRKEEEAKADKWTEINRTTVKNDQTGQTKLTITEVNGQGVQRTREATETEIKQEKPVQLANGRYGRLTFDEAGQITGIQELGVTPAARPEGQTRAKPLSSDVVYSGVARGLSSALTEVYNDTTIDDVERERRAKALIDQAKLIMDEQSTTLAAQQNSLTNRTSQRGQDLQDVQGRRTFAQTIFGDVLKQVGEGASYMPAGSAPKIAAALQGGLQLAQQYGEGLGAFSVVPREMPGVAIQQTDQRGVDGAFPNGQPPAFIAPTTTVMPSVAQPLAGGAAQARVPNAIANAPMAATGLSNGRGLIDQNTFLQLAAQHGGIAGTPVNLSPADAGEYADRPLYRYTMADGAVVEMRNTPNPQLADVWQYIPRAITASAEGN